MSPKDDSKDGSKLLEAAPLAYENPLFLNSPDGRVLRIMSEYAEPLARFRREQIQDTVVFFGSARFPSQEDAKLGDGAGRSPPGPRSCKSCARA